MQIKKSLRLFNSSQGNDFKTKDYANGKMSAH